MGEIVRVRLGRCISILRERHVQRQAVGVERAGCAFRGGVLQAPSSLAKTRDQKCHGLSRPGGRQGLGNPGSQELDFFCRKDRNGGRRSCEHLLEGSLVFLDLHTAQDAGDEGWLQIDRVTGLNRSIGNRLKRHGSARIVKEDLAGWSGRATGGADKTEQGQEERTTVRQFPCRMLW